MLRDCQHPLCQSGKEHEWFPNGPKLDKLLLPVPDPKRPWGSTDCQTCPGFCAGHYLEPEAVICQLDAPTPLSIMRPPSNQLKDLFSKNGSEPTDSELKEIAADCLLPENDVRMWLKHLKTINDNRKRGASKAAETRRKKSRSYHCGVCKALYGKTNEIEFWIACDGCNTWFHGDCVNISRSNEPEEFSCD